MRIPVRAYPVTVVVSALDFLQSLYGRTPCDLLITSKRITNLFRSRFTFSVLILILAGLPVAFLSSVQEIPVRICPRPPAIPADVFCNFSQSIQTNAAVVIAGKCRSRSPSSKSLLSQYSFLYLHFL